MSSRRSESASGVDTRPAPAPVPGPGIAPTGAVLPYGRTEGTGFGSSGWRDTVWNNVPVPILIGLIALLAPVIESRAFGPYNTRIVMLVGCTAVLAVSLQLINGFSGQFSLGHAGFMMVGAYLSGYASINHSQDLSDPGSVLLFFVALFVSVGIGAAALFVVFMLARRSGK